MGRSAAPERPGRPGSGPTVQHGHWGSQVRCNDEAIRLSEAREAATRAAAGVKVAGFVQINPLTRITTVIAHQKAAGRPRLRRRRPRAAACAEHGPMRRVCEGAGLRRELHDELLRGVPRQNLSDDGHASGCPSSLLARPSEGQRDAHGQPRASAIRPTAPITRAMQRQRVAGGPTALCVASRCWRKNVEKAPLLEGVITIHRRRSCRNG